MKKVFAMTILMIVTTLVSLETKAVTGTSDATCGCDTPTGFKMLNAGVYQNSSSTIRFMATHLQDCMAGFYVHHWKFNGSGVVMDSYNSVLTTTVADANLPIGTSTVSYWITLETDAGLIVCTSDSVTQNVTRLN